MPKRFEETPVRVNPGITSSFSAGFLRSVPVNIHWQSPLRGQTPEPVIQGDVDKTDRP